MWNNDNHGVGVSEGQKDTQILSSQSVIGTDMGQSAKHPSATSKVDDDMDVMNGEVERVFCQAV